MGGSLVVGGCDGSGSGSGNGLLNRGKEKRGILEGMEGRFGAECFI